MKNIKLETDESMLCDPILNPIQHQSIKFIQKREWLHEPLASAIGTVIATALLHPLDTIKVRIQSSDQPKSTAQDVFTTMFRNEGVTSFFKGILAPMYALVPQSIITFSIQDQLSEHYFLTNRENHTRYRNMFINGTIAGTVSLMFFVPFEILKITQQNNRTVRESQLKVIINIQNLYGIKGFYRGWWPSWWRDCPTYGLFFMIQQQALDHLTPMFDNKQQAVAISGGLTGFFNWLPGIPFDPVKTNMQKNLVESSMYNVAKCGYKSEGIKFFGKGGGLFLLRGVPHSTILFVTQEMLKDKFTGRLL